MTFEAPRELLDPGTRDRTLQEIRELGVDRVRVLVYWKDYAPAATSKRRPDFDAADPNAYPAGAWARLDGLFDSAQARGITVQLTLTGPVPRWATKGKRDNVTSPSTKEFQAFATAVGRRFGDRVGVWSIWNEPNHPQFLLPQFVKKQAPSRRGSTATSSSPASAAWPPRATAPTRCCSARPRRAAPRASSRRWRSCAGRCAWTELPPAQGRCARVSAGGFAHHAYTTRVGPRFRPPDRDDVTIGVLSRLTQRARPRRPAGRDPPRPRRLPDGVRDPEHPRPVRRRVARAPGRVPRDRRAHGLRQPARAVVLAVPAERRQARARAAASSATAASSPACGAPTGRRSRPTPRSGCRSRPRPTAAPTSSGAACARSRPDQGHDPRLAAQGQAVQAAAHGHHQPPRRLRPARAGTATSSATACSGPRRTARSGAARRSAPARLPEPSAARLRRAQRAARVPFAILGRLPRRRGAPGVGGRRLRGDPRLLASAPRRSRCCRASR